MTVVRILRDLMVFTIRRKQVCSQRLTTAFQLPPFSAQKKLPLSILSGSFYMVANRRLQLSQHQLGSF